MLSIDHKAKRLVFQTLSPMQQRPLCQSCNAVGVTWERGTYNARKAENRRCHVNICASVAKVRPGDNARSFEHLVAVVKHIAVTKHKKTMCEHILG